VNAHKQAKSKINSNMEPKNAEKRRAENIKRNMDFQRQQIGLIDGTSPNDFLIINLQNFCLQKYH